MPKFDNIVVNSTIQIPSKSANPTSDISQGQLYWNSSDGALKLYNGSAWSIVKGFKDGSTQALAARSAADIRELGVSQNGQYWIDLPTLGPTLMYCDMETDEGGWMMFSYCGAIGSFYTEQAVIDSYGTIHASPSYGNTSFSRFEYAAQMEGVSQTTSHMMWRRTNDRNVIFIHEVGEMLNRMPTSNNDRNFNGSGSGYPFSQYLKLSNSGINGLVARTPSQGRYEGGPSYWGIAWNSSYEDNRDGVGGFNDFLNRRSLIYGETNDRSTYMGQWFHADPLQMGPSRGPTYGTGKLDIEVFFRDRKPNP